MAKKTGMVFAMRNSFMFGVASPLPCPRATGLCSDLSSSEASTEATTLRCQQPGWTGSSWAGAVAAVSAWGSVRSWRIAADGGGGLR